MTTFDVWLRDGLVVDGTGRAPFHGHVGIRGETIEVVADPDENLQPPAGEIVDCTGHVVAPGLIDIHTHSDVSFLLDPMASSKVMQGVTTEVTGNCGFSPFPVHPQRRQALVEFLRGLGTPLIDVSWDNFDGYAKAVTACRPLMNVAPLAGHGALRIAVVGTENVTITGGVLKSLVGTLRDCLEQGAFGLSTGLTYVPSSFASADEIQKLAQVLSKYDALYATHARATADTFGTFDEAIDVGRRSAARVQFSHVALNDPQMWGRAGEVVRRFERAVEAGIDIRYDVYPYAASASSLAQYLPGWVQEGGEAGLRELLADRVRFDDARAELARGLYGTIPWDWERVVVSLAGQGDEMLEGQSIAAAAEVHGVSPEEVCLRLCERHGNRTQVVLFYRTEDDVTEFVRHPLAIVGSDGNAMPVTAPGRPHPRSFGAHARLLQRYVTERERLSLAEAVYKSTLAPAQRLRIRDRGVIATGARADIVVFNPVAVRETATWTNPCQLARGVRDVWINGQHVVAGEALTGRRAGQVLRRAA